MTTRGCTSARTAVNKKKNETTKKKNNNPKNTKKKQQKKKKKKKKKKTQKKAEWMETSTVRRTPPRSRAERLSRIFVADLGGGGRRAVVSAVEYQKQAGRPAWMGRRWPKAAACMACPGCNVARTFRRTAFVPRPAISSPSFRHRGGAGRVGRPGGGPKLRAAVGGCRTRCGRGKPGALQRPWSRSGDSNRAHPVSPTGWPHSGIDSGGRDLQQAHRHFRPQGAVVCQRPFGPRRGAPPDLAPAWPPGKEQGRPTGDSHATGVGTCPATQYQWHRRPVSGSVGDQRSSGPAGRRTSSIRRYHSSTKPGQHRSPPVAGTGPAAAARTGVAGHPGTDQILPTWRLMVTYPGVLTFALALVRGFDTTSASA